MGQRHLSVYFQRNSDICCNSINYVDLLLGHLLGVRTIFTYDKEEPKEKIHKCRNIMSENVPLDTLLEHLPELNVHFCGDFEETSKLTGISGSTGGTRVRSSILPARTI